MAASADIGFRPIIPARVGVVLLLTFAGVQVFRSIAVYAADPVLVPWAHWLGVAAWALLIIPAAINVFQILIGGPSRWAQVRAAYIKASSEQRAASTWGAIYLVVGILTLFAVGLLFAKDEALQTLINDLGTWLLPSSLLLYFVWADKTKLSRSGSPGPGDDQSR